MLGEAPLWLLTVIVGVQLVADMIGIGFNPLHALFDDRADAASPTDNCDLHSGILDGDR